MPVEITLVAKFDKWSVYLMCICVCVCMCSVCPHSRAGLWFRCDSGAHVDDVRRLSRVLARASAALSLLVRLGWEIHRWEHKHTSTDPDVQAQLRSNWSSLLVVTELRSLCLCADDKQYDVYISYARNSEEEEFVLSTLRRVLETEFGYSVCIFDRDSLPGGSEYCVTPNIQNGSQ